ncbi:PHP domain-containing protein [Candidatus Bipolaricaulota bacterium]|nr:PHP domain-containing protein [Candidatus Bipolaricaulota bacterium]
MRQGFGDLHLHTTASDGTQSVDELARRARSAGLTTIAITDHDTIPPELSQRVQWIEGVDVITGTELKVDFGAVRGELLAYFIDPRAARLCALFAEMQVKRVERMDRMVERCCEQLGVSITPGEVRAAASGSLGRPHLARLLVEHGVVSTQQDAFHQFLGTKRPCYVSMSKPALDDVLAAVREAGGVTSLAHPCLMTVEDWPRFLEELRAAGVDGVETFYAYRNFRRSLPMAPRRMAAMASDLGFLLTGGSDDHGPGSTKQSLGEIRLAPDRVAAVRELADERAKAIARS